MAEANLTRLALQAQSNANRDRSGASMAVLLGRGPGSKQATTPRRDFARENVLRLRQIQAERRITEQMQQEMQSSTQPFKLAQFKHVGPKVATTRRPGSAEKLRPALPEQTQPPQQHREEEEEEEEKEAKRQANKAAGRSPKPVLRHSVSTPDTRGYRRRESKLPPVPRAEDAAPKPRHVAKDHVRLNRLAVPQSAASTQQQQLEQQQQRDWQAPEFGRVPKYLQARKAAQAMEKVQRERAEAHAAECPPGMRILGDDERRETLDLLRQKRTALEQELKSLPLIIDTFGLKQRKSKIEASLNEVNEAAMLFARPKVLVADTDE